jgi:hypothetical protein
MNLKGEESTVGVKRMVRELTCGRGNVCFFWGGGDRSAIRLMLLYWLMVSRPSNQGQHLFREYRCCGWWGGEDGVYLHTIRHRHQIYGAHITRDRLNSLSVCMSIRLSICLSVSGSSIPGLTLQDNTVAYGGTVSVSQLCPATSVLLSVCLSVRCRTILQPTAARCPYRSMMSSSALHPVCRCCCPSVTSPKMPPPRVTAVRFTYRICHGPTPSS